MSEPTNAEMAEQEDKRLDAQIDELMEARYREVDEREAPPILVEVEDDTH